MVRARSEQPASTERTGVMRVRFATVLVATALFAPPVQADDPPTTDAARLASAHAAVKGLGETLKAQLVAAIKAGGPIAAVGVCRTIAPAIAEEKSRAHGLKVGRTALKVRNRDNAPDEFERRVLEEFVRKIDAGADPATLEHAETVTQGDERVFRYMKAIPTAAEPCLTCHGSKPGARSQGGNPAPLSG